MNYNELLDFYSRPGKYIPLPIIKSKIKSFKELVYSYKNINVYCYICHYECDKLEIETESSKFYNQLKHYINSTIDFIKPKPSNLVILLSLNNEKKKFPKTNVITPENVNNGLTTLFRDNTRHIFIYRKQDVFKVLIHEMIHYFDADFNDKTITGISDKLALSFIEENGLNYNEAFVEAMAIYLFCLFSKKDINYYVNRGIRVAKAILGQPDYVKTKKMYQNTNGYSYYICRAALLLNIPLLLSVFKTKDIQQFAHLVNKSMLQFDIEIKKKTYIPLKSMQVIIVNDLP